MKVSIGVSNRHIHLKKEDLNILFGENYSLTPLKNLNQFNQFASTDKVTIKTQKSFISNVRILGPVRSYTQVEISKTDAFKLGINPPVRNSGDLKGSSPIEVIGPKGSILLNEGCILATRHMHITPNERKEYGLENVNKVSIKIDGIKGGILDSVYLSESEDAYFEVHLDTDDANGHLIKDGDVAQVIVD